MRLSSNWRACKQSCACLLPRRHRLVIVGSNPRRHPASLIATCTVNTLHTAVVCKDDERQTSVMPFVIGPSKQRQVAAITVPESLEACLLPQALHKLLPEYFTSITAAKRACRRGEVLLDGSRGQTSSSVLPAQCIQVMALFASGEGAEELRELAAEDASICKGAVCGNVAQKLSSDTKSTSPAPVEGFGSGAVNSSIITPSPTTPVPVEHRSAQHLSNSVHQQQQQDSEQQQTEPLPQQQQQQQQQKQQGGEQQQNLQAEQDRGSLSDVGTQVILVGHQGQQTLPGSPPKSKGRVPRPLDPVVLRPHIAVLYEDCHMAVVVKPPGIPTQGHGPQTLQGLLPYILKPSTEPGMLRKAIHVHRLDQPTGGLLMVAKTRLALTRLGTALAERRVFKRYMALVKGERSGSGFINLPLSGQDACTEYHVTQVTHLPGYGPISTVNLILHTGRTHQIRKHMSYTGTPLLGETQHRGTEPPTEAKRIAACTRIAQASKEETGPTSEVEDELQPHSPASSPALSSSLVVAAAAPGAVQAATAAVFDLALSSPPAASAGSSAAVVGVVEQDSRNAGTSTMKSSVTGVFAASINDITPQVVSSVGERKGNPQLACQGRDCDDVTGALQTGPPQSSSQRDDCGADVAEPTGEGGGCSPVTDLGSPYPSPAYFARNLDVLPSGQVPGLCLWAVELRIRHPITDVELHLVLPDPPEFRDLLAENRGGLALG